MKLPLLLLLLQQLLLVKGFELAPEGTCSKSLNIGADYLLNSELFANATKLDLPASIDLPLLSAIKIVNIKVTGLEKASRNCNLQLSSPGRSQLQLKACASLENVHISFMLRVRSLPLDFVTARISDASASFVAVAEAVPGGRVRLLEFSVGFGNILVTNTGLTGAIISRVLTFNSVREKVRVTVQQQVQAAIQRELEKFRLPK